MLQICNVVHINTLSTDLLRLISDSRDSFTRLLISRLCFIVVAMMNLYEEFKKECNKLLVLVIVEFKT